MDIPYDVEPIEEEGYPLYSIITEFLPFSTEQKVVSTSDKADADALFEKACRDNSAVKLTVQTADKNGEYTKKEITVTLVKAQTSNQ